MLVYVNTYAYTYTHAYTHTSVLSKFVHVWKQIWISPMEKSKCLTPVWISPLEKSKLVPKIWISTSEKSIHAEIDAHIWVCPFWNPNMCIYTFIYGFLQRRNPYFWHLLGFTQWGNLNWHQKIQISQF